jgi:DNA-binding IclR family transcriptional regulator
MWLNGGSPGAVGEPVPNAGDFNREIKEVRQVGYATDRSEFCDGVGGVGAPLTSGKGYEGLASCLGPIERIEELGLERLGRRLGTRREVHGR